MAIVFFCQSCGARFEVDPRMAGKKGRCKKCGQVGSIPRAEQLASMSSIPALAAAGAAAVATARQPQAASVGESIGGFLRGAASSVGLAPISVQQMPAVRRGSKPSPLDDAEDSKPYMIAGPTPGPAARVGDGASRAVGAGLRVWRREVGMVQKVFRWLNQSAYLVSLPFLMILIVGTVLKSRPTALFGATFVVVLNLGRIAAGIGNLAVIPLREGVNAGKKMKKPLGRVIEPALTIVAVVLAFTFIPWLSEGGKSDASLTDRIRSGAADLKAEMKKELGKTADEARKLDVDRVGGAIQKGLESVSGAGGPAETAPAPAGKPGAK